MAQGRPPLTFDGEPATVPLALTDHERLAVSFLLEEDRARAMKLRAPIVNLREVLQRHVVAGGPQADSGRLDYLVTWATAAQPLDHRTVSDSIASSDHTPGARLSNARSDAIHQARFRDLDGRAARGRGYEELVEEELRYKTGVVDASLAYLSTLEKSRLREVYRALEGDAQAVWRDRLRLHASDLVRFGRTNWVWRNAQVDMLDQDSACLVKLQALGNRQVALDLAIDAGTREVALATVITLDPVRLELASRRIKSGSQIAMLHRNHEACVELPETQLKTFGYGFKFGQLSVGALTADTDGSAALVWSPKKDPKVAVGDVLVVADLAWLGGGFSSGHEVAVNRPKRDTSSAPKGGCDETSYESDPESHKYCCRPHEVAEADIADWIADQRAKGLRNPRAWPPIVDDDQFDTPAVETPTDADTARPGMVPEEGLTIDDLD